MIKLITKIVAAIIVLDRLRWKEGTLLYLKKVVYKNFPFHIISMKFYCNTYQWSRCAKKAAAIRATTDWGARWQRYCSRCLSETSYIHQFPLFEEQNRTAGYYFPLTRYLFSHCLWLWFTFCYKIDNNEKFTCTYMIAIIHNSVFDLRLVIIHVMRNLMRFLFNLK